MTDFVTVEAKVLAKTMKFANAIIELRNTIPILNTVKLSYSSRGLVISATDLDLMAAISVDEIDGSGTWEACVPSRDFASIASAAGVAPLHIAPVTAIVDMGKSGEMTERRVTITAGDATYSILAQDPEDFPHILGERMQLVERFTNGQFAAMLRKVNFCISTEETRYYLNGVNWSASTQGRRLAATDGHRLALCRYDGNENNAEFSYIIPRKTVSTIMQFLDAADLHVHSVGSGNKINDLVLDIQAPGVSLRTKLIDGTFPQVDRVIPKDEKHFLDIRRDEMLSAIRQATAISGWRGQAIRLGGVSGRLNVETKNPDLGTAKVTTSAEWPDGVDAIGLNSKYLTQMVGNCQGAIKLGMTSPGAPVTLSDDDKDMTRVVMPMRV